MQIPLVNLLNPNHALCKVPLEWNEVYGLFTDLLLSGYEEDFIRLMTSLVILEDLYELTPEQTLKIWEENPHWQAFSGLQSLQTSCPASLEQYTAFRRMAGKQRLLALGGMVPIFQNEEENPSGQTERATPLSGAPTPNSADIRRALLPKDPSQISFDSMAKKKPLRSDPHFDTVKPLLVDVPKEKPLVLEIHPMGEGPFTYQWFQWSQSNRVEELVPNAQKANLVIPFEPKSYFVGYRCQVKNAQCAQGRNSRWFFLRPSATLAG